MEKKLTTSEKILLRIWIFIMTARETASRSKMFIQSRFGLFLARLWIRKDEFPTSLSFDYDFLTTSNQQERNWYWNDLTRRRKIAQGKEMEGPTGQQYQKKLLNLLNEKERDSATSVIDCFSIEKNIKRCTRVMLPVHPGSGDRQLIVFLDEIELAFEYSGFIWKKWRNKW
jgi:hypothetical protein